MFYALSVQEYQMPPSHAHPPFPPYYISNNKASPAHRCWSTHIRSSHWGGGEVELLVQRSAASPPPSFTSLLNTARSYTQQLPPPLSTVRRKRIVHKVVAYELLPLKCSENKCTLLCICSPVYYVYNKFKYSVISKYCLPRPSWVAVFWLALSAQPTRLLIFQHQLLYLFQYLSTEGLHILYNIIMHYIFIVFSHPSQMIP